MRDAMPCARCCEDVDIWPVHLLRPDLLDADGQEFVRVHGLDQLTLADLSRGAILLPDGRVKVHHRCAQLTADRRCGIYATRPRICRDYVCAIRTGDDACTREETSCPMTSLS